MRTYRQVHLKSKHLQPVKLNLSLSSVINALVSVCMYLLSVSFRATAGPSGPGKATVQTRAERGVESQRTARDAEGSPAKSFVQPYTHPAAFRQTA